MGVRIETPGGGASGSATNHATLSNLDYGAAGHTDFQQSIPTGTTVQFYRGDKTFALVSDTGTNCPVNATYIVQTANATLTNEQILADLNTGLLKVTSGTGLLSVASTASDYQIFIETGTTAQFYRGDKTWTLVPDTGGGASVVYAPTGATYIVQVASATLTNEQALADLATGILKGTSGTGLVSIAVAGVDYESPVATGTAVQLYHGDKTFTSVVSATTLSANVLNVATTTTTVTLDISSTAPVVYLTDTTASATSLKIDVDANVAQIREKAAGANSLLSLNLSTNHIGIGTAPDADVVLYLNKTWTSGGAGNLKGFGILNYANTGVTATDSIGLYGSTYTLGTATVTNLRGLQFDATLLGSENITVGNSMQLIIGNFGSGTITNAHFIDLRALPASGVTNSIGLRMVRDTGSRTRKYGFYYGAAAVGSEPTGSYAIYADTDNSYFGGSVGIQVTSPTAILHLKAGTAAVNTAPLKIASGTNLTTPEAGAMEYDGVDLYFTPVATRLTIASTNKIILWNEVTGTSQTALVNNGYICNNAALVTVTLPSTAAIGEIVRVVGSGAGGWKIAQNAGQSVKFGNVTTTTGTGGYLQFVNRYDAAELICITANTTFSVISSQGNITYV